MKIIKKIIKDNVHHLFNIDTVDKIRAYSILNNQYRGLEKCKRFYSREELWDYSIKGLHDNAITYIEYGVHQGYSIKYFSQQNKNQNSIFVGLDSFEGLPEDWGNSPKGTFNENGRIPKVDDARVVFIKGWFQNTDNNVFATVDFSKALNLIVHFDADLYSSTLFGLSKMDVFRKPYIAIFDEFEGHECRALYDYCKSHAAAVEFVGRTLSQNKYPNQVLCKITPRSE